MRNVSVYAGLNDRPLPAMNVPPTVIGCPGRTRCTAWVTTGTVVVWPNPAVSTTELADEPLTGAVVSIRRSWLAPGASEKFEGDTVPAADAV